MYRPLCPCPACARHVLSTERECPFCRSVIPEDLLPRERPALPRRLSRAAAFAFGTTLAVGACSSTTTTTDAAGADTARDTPTVDNAASDVPTDDGSIFPLYGDPPPRDAGFDAVDDEGAPGPEYGAPFDAGSPDATPSVDAARDVVNDEGGSVLLYGAPSPPQPDGG